MDGFSNIEIVNFDAVEVEANNDNVEVCDINMEYLNNFILNKFNCDENMNKDSQMSYTNSLDTYDLCSNYSFMSYCNSDAVSCVSDTFNLAFSCDTSMVDRNNFYNSFDNCKKNYDNSPSSAKLETSPSSSLFSGRTFKCVEEGCEKSYKSKENLNLHIKNIHLKEKPYNCKYCPALFSHRNGKTYHERKFHTKYLPHKCHYESNFNFNCRMYALLCE